MKTSSAGRAAIAQREGRRLSAYRDSRGIWTIGVGHAATGLPPRPYAGMTISEAECDALLAADLAPVEAAINAAITVPVGQNEFDALASLGFNIGIGGLRRSSVVRKLNSGDVLGAADAFMNWCKPAVLTGRREKEREQFLAPDPPGATGVSPSHAVAAARATALANHAVATKAKANTTAVGGTAAAVIAASGTVVAATGGGGHHLLWVVGLVAAGGAAIDGIVTIVQRQSAATLSINAAAQVATAAKLAKPPTLVPSALPKA